VGGDWNAAPSASFRRDTRDKRGQLAQKNEHAPRGMMCLWRKREIPQRRTRGAAAAVEILKGGAAAGGKKR